jgi:hypothetical protein
VSSVGIAETDVSSVSVELAVVAATELAGPVLAGVAAELAAAGVVLAALDVVAEVVAAGVADGAAVVVV